VSLLQTTLAFLLRERKKGRGRSRDVEVSRTTGWKPGERMRGLRGKIPLVSIVSFEPATAWLTELHCMFIYCSLHCITIFRAFLTIKVQYISMLVLHSLAGTDVNLITTFMDYFELIHIWFAYSKVLYQGIVEATVLNNLYIYKLYVYINIIKEGLMNNFIVHNTFEILKC
jgi:hypothetical protein